MRFEQPGIEGQPQFAEVAKPLAECRVQIEPLRRMERCAEHVGVRAGERAYRAPRSYGYSGYRGRGTGFSFPRISLLAARLGANCSVIACNRAAFDASAPPHQTWRNKVSHT